MPHFESDLSDDKMATQVNGDTPSISSAFLGVGLPSPSHGCHTTNNERNST